MAKVQRPPPEEAVDSIIDLVEALLFPLSLHARAGYKVRGVRPAKQVRMLGHIGMTEQVCRWFNTELRLGHNPVTVSELSLDHDLAKAINRDEPRIPDIPTSRIAAFIRRFVDNGLSYDDRRQEHRGVVAVLRPYFTETPEIWAATSASLELYFLRPRLRLGARGLIAWFVHNIGQVLDVHLALWYARKGYMDITQGNVRTFTERLERRIRDETAKLYWSRVKQRYLPEISQVYPTKRVALAQ